MIEPPFRENSPLAEVDPRIGCEAADLPEPRGVAATWWVPKPPVGNTHPGATLPFGMVSVCAYSGAYVTGYGRYGVSLSGDPPTAIFDGPGALGLAHFQQSGTGRIRSYYNYLLTAPLDGSGPAGLGTRWTLADERAWPGYYAGRFVECGVEFETVAMARGVRHRYRFPEGAEPAIAVDVSAGGLRIEGMELFPQGATLRIDGTGAVIGEVVMEGVPIHFHVESPGAEAFLWEDEGELAGQSDYELTLEKQKLRPAFGFGFRRVGGREIECAFGFSLRAPGRAASAAGGSGGFEAAVDAAADAWRAVLGRIEIEGGDAGMRRVFRTALYHASLKPADFSGENPFTLADGPFFFDLSTLWDLYKTQLPLMMTLWPERAADFVEFLCEVARREGAFPVSYLMNNEPDRFTKQATGLCHAILEDARLRGIDADWERVLSLLWRTSQSGKGRKGRFGEYARRGEVDPLSHTLDISYAHFCMARMARAAGDQPVHDRAAALVGNWRGAFDVATGLLREDSTYYEGEHWNYSFRLMHDMKARIELAGGERAFTKLLDQFFGFAEPDPGQTVFRFEGLNNEPDMEAPYAYLYAGRHDRTAEIVRRVMQCRFATGRGGLPGNDDSGGLSSWLVWSAIGLFPVCAQPVVLIGSPWFDRATLRLGERSFTVVAENQGPERFHVSRARLNGGELNRCWLNLSEFLGGGELVLEMSDQPGTFGRRDRPPSFADG